MTNEAVADRIDEQPISRPLTLARVRGIESSVVDTVDIQNNVPLTPEEKAGAVVSVDCVTVTPYRRGDRTEAYAGLSPGFRSALIRVQNHEVESDSTIMISAESYHGNPVSGGTHTSERQAVVVVLDSNGNVIEGYNQTTKEHWDPSHPRPEGTLEIIKGEPLNSEELEKFVSSLVHDIDTCVNAGI